MRWVVDAADDVLGNEGILLFTLSSFVSSSPASELFVVAAVAAVSTVSAAAAVVVDTDSFVLLSASFTIVSADSVVVVAVASVFSSDDIW